MIYDSHENGEERIPEEKVVGDRKRTGKKIIRTKTGRQDGTPKRAVLSVLLCFLLAGTVPGTLTGCGSPGIQTENTAENGQDESAKEGYSGKESSEDAEEAVTGDEPSQDTDEDTGEQGEDGKESQSKDAAAEQTAVLSLDEIHLGESSLSASQAIQAMEEAKSLAACLNTASTGQVENWEGAGLTASVFVELASSQAQSYYFSQLVEKNQYQRELIYLVLQYMAQERAEKIEIPCKDTEDITEIFTMVTDDHPELFDVSGYQSQIYTDQNDAITHITLTGKYTMDAEERRQLQEKMEPVVQKILQEAPNGDDDYEKVRYVYDYVIRQTDYDENASYNQTMCSVFIYGKSVCQGYARAAQYLLQQMGIPCVIAAGEVHDGVRHAWDVVKADGEWYHMDPTWGDPSYASDEEAVSMEAYVDYDYLLITSEEIARTHVLYQEEQLPLCTATADNYYVREGNLLEKWDRNVFKLMLAVQEQEGNAFPSVKCISQEVFEEMKQDLVNQGHLSECLPAGTGAGRIRYTENADLYTMTVFLPQ